VSKTLEPRYRGSRRESSDCQRTGPDDHCPERWRNFQARVRLHTECRWRAPERSTWPRKQELGGPLIAVEYFNGRLTDVTSDGGQYDFNWSRLNDEVYWHESGSGGTDGTYPVSRYVLPTGKCDADGKPEFLPPDPTAEPQSWIWLAPGVVPIEELGWDAKAYRYRGQRVLSREDLREMGYLLLDELPGDPFEDAEERETVYCDVCHDDLPLRAYELEVCDHVYWCDGHGGYGGEGVDESGRVCLGGPHDDEDET
jgi:hypothetical protein